MPRAVHIFFSGYKEICYTVLNEPHREPMVQQISFWQRECNLIEHPCWTLTVNFFYTFVMCCFVMFCLKNHIFKSNGNQNQSEELGCAVINPASIGDETELPDSLYHSLPQEGLRIPVPLTTVYILLFFSFYFILLYNTVLVLPYIDMNPFKRQHIDDSAVLL